MGHFFAMHFAFVQFIPRCQCTCMFIQNAYIRKTTTYKHINSDHNMMPNQITKLRNIFLKKEHGVFTRNEHHVDGISLGIIYRKRQFWECSSQSVSWNNIIRRTGSTTLVRSCVTLIVSSHCVCIQEYALMAIISEMNTYTSFVL